eukprot:CAMPEP_0116851438 /NCGR_PEP_ID=MMETSP0418-20121206/16726_1 /TAXON_ID=1158023 /ORGANISM="Astrosyne radiata, Strain 13vi08-1A" /LENGTH=264 /DNA_ID=CAMNT_0004483467 /DNA_START=87 /DNA_END=881 /DNA_ORIENTATION=+
MAVTHHQVALFPMGRGIEQSHSSVTNIPASVNQRPSAPAPTDQTNPTRQEDDGDEVAIVWTKSLEPSSNRNAFVFKNVLRIPETFGTCDPSHDRGVQDVEVMIAAAILFNMGVLLHIANQNGGEATLARASHLYQRSCNALLLFQERSILRRISNKSSSHHDFCPDTTTQTMMKVFSHFMLIAVLNNVATICYECGHYEMAREYAHVMVHRIHVFSPETTGSPRQHTQTQPLGSSDALFWRKEMQDFLMNAMVLGRTPTMASAA